MSNRPPWLCVVLFLCSCGAGAASSAPPVEGPRTATANLTASPPSAGLSELRVGTSGDYAPFSVRDAAGRVEGFDTELAEQLAHDLGVPLRWVPFRWPDLRRQLESGEFDVAMGGVTWQPARAVLGYMTRAVARGGPCVLGDPAAARVAVNRGGALEAWARGQFQERELVTMTDNMSLPSLLAEGRVGAIVTDSFERRAFERPEWKTSCEPALWRKVYWVGPAHARELGTRIDDWLQGNGARVQQAQKRWFGEPQRLDATQHLVDLIARRFAFMPLVAGLKAARGLPIEDLPREREVLDATAVSARSLGLPEQPVHDLFALQIALSKAVQRRQSEPSTLDLSGQIRPALGELGQRILEALVEARSARQLGSMTLADLELLSPWLTPEETARLLASLRALDATVEPHAE